MDVLSHLKNLQSVSNATPTQQPSDIMPTVKPPPEIIQTPTHLASNETLAKTDKIIISNQHMVTLKPIDETRNGEVDEPTVDHILSAELKPVHYADPTIVKFIAAYIACRHVGQASRAVGIRPADGNSLLNRPDINRAVNKVSLASARKFGFDASEVLARANEIIQIDPADTIDDKGAVIDIKLMSPETRRAIKSMKVKEVYEMDANGMKVGATGRIVSIEFWDKMKSIELLGKQEGLFVDTIKVEHEIGKNAAALLLGAAERRALSAAKPVTPLQIEARDVTDEK